MCVCIYWVHRSKGLFFHFNPHTSPPLLPSSPPPQPLYPCFGLKQSGDSLSLRSRHWVGTKGLAPPGLLTRFLYAQSIISSWRAAYHQPYLRFDQLFPAASAGAGAGAGAGGYSGVSSTSSTATDMLLSAPFPAALTEQLYVAYRRWKANDKVVVMSRPGLEGACQMRSSSAVYVYLRVGRKDI